MKNKYKFIIITVLVVAVFITILLFLNSAKKEINPDHIKLKFIIHSSVGVAKSEDLLKNEFLKPLLKYHLAKDKNSQENLYFTSVTCEKTSFCIPAQGINFLRYSANSSIAESNYTAEAREGDEASFFESWNGGESLNALIKSLLKDKKDYTLPDISKITNQNRNLFIDSLILCTDCSDSFLRLNEPFIFKNSSDLRKFVNQQLEKFDKNQGNSVVNRNIHVFSYRGLMDKGQVVVNNDSDGDGVPDNVDHCPKDRGLKEFKGCADDDGDGIPNPEDQCPTQLGDLNCSGCPCIITKCPDGDKDKDGICDKVDACPDDFGLKKNNGCPPDSDKDGVWDRYDKCPNEKGLKIDNGCPDKDGDHVPDYLDECPTEKGTKANKGCPGVSREVNVEFNKANPKTNNIKFTSTNITFKENDKIEVVIFLNGQEISNLKLLPSDIRSNTFKVSGSQLLNDYEKIYRNRNPETLNVNMEMKLNGKFVGKRSGPISIFCYMSY